MMKKSSDISASVAAMAFRSHSLTTTEPKTCEAEMSEAASETGSVPAIMASRYCTSSDTTSVKMKKVSGGEWRLRKVCRPKTSRASAAAVAAATPNASAA